MNSLTSKIPCIYVLALGGTIASPTKAMEEFYGHSSISIDRLINSLPFEPQKIKILSKQFLQQISQDMSHKELIAVAQQIDAIVKNNEIDGIVIAQGTNCIEETAYFINLVIKTKKPIVFTGSFRPANTLGYDGSRNLYNAILIASSYHTIGIGVVLTFNDTILSARDASKSNPSNIACFSTNGVGIIGSIAGQSVCIQSSFKKKHTYLSEFDINTIKNIPQIYIIYGHLGMDNIFINAAIDNHAQGIISAGMGTGYLPKAVMKSLNEAVKKGIFVVRCSRTGQGLVNIDPKLDNQQGSIAGNSLSPQKARLLLAIALLKTKDKAEIQRIFNQY
jgi:L-asparaginase